MGEPCHLLVWFLNSYTRVRDNRFGSSYDGAPLQCRSPAPQRHAVRVLTVGHWGAETGRLEFAGGCAAGFDQVQLKPSLESYRNKTVLVKPPFCIQMCGTFTINYFTVASIRGALKRISVHYRTSFLLHTRHLRNLL